jgi:ATP-dependent Clp protease protease subunit
MGAFLLSSGTKGFRYAYQNCEIMIHQPLGGFEGQVTDMDIMNKRYLYLKEKLIELLSLHTGKNKEKIAQDTERNYFMTSYNAIEYGLIDKII